MKGVVAFGFIVSLALLNGAILVTRTRTRRKLVLDFLEAQNLSVLVCKHSFQLRPNWNTYFSIRVQDETGHTRSGLATATGKLRRKTWVDWNPPDQDRSASALDALRKSLRTLGRTNP